MSKPRYDWWAYVRGIVKRYPELLAAYKECDMSGSAIYSLPTTNQREYEAVRRAIVTTRKYRTGKARLQIVERYYWGEPQTLEKIASALAVSKKDANAWNQEFIYLVASYYGLMND